LVLFRYVAAAYEPIPRCRQSLAIRSQLDQLQGVTSRAFDAAGNQSAVLTSVRVQPIARPKSSPKQIPHWAWQLLRWQQSGQQGTRPKTPTSLPSWYAA